METYTLLRAFADSWHMLFMLLFFLGVVVYVLFGRSSSYSDVAGSIFRNDDTPKPDGAAHDGGPEDGQNDGSR